MKRIILIAALAFAGVGTAIAVAAGTSPTTGTQTFTNVVTYTIPTVTETVTVTTTVGTTTTPTTTNTPPPANSYEQAISYSNTRPSFTPTRTVNVSSAATLRTALANLQGGDLIQASSPFTVPATLTISNRPATRAEIDLTGVSVTFSGNADTPGIVINNASNLYIFGGDATTGSTGGMCARVFGSQNVLWWGFNLHTCGDTGLQMIASGSSPTDLDDIQGTISNVGLDLAYDPHSDKGTGLHAANLWDGPSSAAFSNNRFAIDAHDIPVGACIEWGNDSGTAPGNTVYLRCVHETDVSKTMTGGNGIQFWGAANGTTGLDIKYIECTDLQGACVYSIANSAGVTVDYGRASDTNQNPQVTGDVWNKTHGIVYKDVLPTP